MRTMSIRRTRNSVLLNSEEGTFEILDSGAVIFYAPDKKRYIGVWDGETYTYKRTIRSDAHKHKKTDSYAFPYFVIGYLVRKEGLKYLAVEDEGKAYTLDISAILTPEGKIDRTKVSIMRYGDFETQIFIPRRLFHEPDAQKRAVQKRRQRRLI